MEPGSNVSGSKSKAQIGTRSHRTAADSTSADIWGQLPDYVDTAIDEMKAGDSDSVAGAMLYGN